MRQPRPASFVVRVVQGGQGQITGVIERAATGAKEAFTSPDAIGEVILRMLGHECTPEDGLTHAGEA